MLAIWAGLRTGASTVVEREMKITDAMESPIQPPRTRTWVIVAMIIADGS